PIARYKLFHSILYFLCSYTTHITALLISIFAGNLTKHILKHHKKEQNAYIGKDDIIIKKVSSKVTFLLLILNITCKIALLNGNNNGSNRIRGSNKLVQQTRVSC
uniref:Ovule protein n=1 Tax=Syphacia muris TaxID=451379 RepID=A0A0N5AYN7_9BILA